MGENKYIGKKSIFHWDSILTINLIVSWSFFGFYHHLDSLKNIFFIKNINNSLKKSLFHMFGKVVNSTLNFQQVLIILLNSLVKRVLQLKNMNGTIFCWVCKHWLFFSPRSDNLDCIMKLHDIPTMTNHKYFLFRKWILFV